MQALRVMFRPMPMQPEYPSPPPLPSAPPRLPWLLRVWLAVAAAGVGASLVGHLLIGLNTDHLDIMDQVSRLIAGGEPYYAFADVNPPLVHLLYLVPTLLAEFTTLPLHTSLYLCVYGMGLLSLYTVFHVLAAAPRSLRWLAVSGFALAMSVTSFQHQVFADRDHLMLVFLAPWLALNSPLAAWEAAPALWRRRAALLAAAGFALKPYYLLYYVAIILWRMPQERLLHQLKRREHHILWLCGVGYAALIALFFPRYLTDMAPLLWYTYGANSWTMDSKWAVMQQTLQQFWPVWLWAAAALSLTRGLPRRVVAYLLLLQLLGVAMYLLNAGWWYTQYSFLGANLLLCLGGGIALLPRVKAWHRTAPFALLPALGVTLFVLHIMPASDRALTDIAHQRVNGRPLAVYLMNPKAWPQVQQQLQGSQRYLFFSTNLRALSLQQPGQFARSTGRYDHLWPLPGLAQLRADPARQPRYNWLRDIFMQGIVDDMRTYKPERVVIDVSAYLPPLPKDFSILGYLREYPAFEEQWQHYQLLKHINTCDTNVIAACAFDIYGAK